MQLASLINGALPPTTTELAGAAGALRSWSAGQVLDAAVLRAGNGQALLQIGGQQVLAQARVPLMVGQTVRLQVEKSGTQPQLRVLDGDAAPKGTVLQTLNRATANSALPVNARGGQAAASGLPQHAPVTLAGQEQRPGTNPVSGEGTARQSHSAAQTTTLNPGAAARAQSPTSQQAPASQAALLANVPGKVASEAVAAQVLRQALPARQSFPQSMSALEQFVAAVPQARAHPMIEQARAVAADLLRGLPRPQDAADPKQLRAMLQRSGLFHEAQLAQRGHEWSEQGEHDGDEARVPSRQTMLNPPPADLKARLSAVAESLATAVRAGVQMDQSSEQAAAALRGALSNIEANQVASVRATEQGPAQSAVWRVDLPLADANGQQALEFRIAREPRGSQDLQAPPSWVAEVTVQPPGQPAVHARIALNGETVYTTFTTESESLAQRIASGEAELRQLLEVVDLTLGGMRCCEDALDQPGADLMAKNLISEHA